MPAKLSKRINALRYICQQILAVPPIRWAELDEAVVGKSETFRHIIAQSGGKNAAAVIALQHATERVPVEKIAEFQILSQHVEAFVPAEPLQFGWVNAAVHPGGERATFETVTA